MTALLDHLWQSTVFAAVAGAFTLLLRNNSARVRYGLWLAASLKFLFPFAWLVAAGSYLSQFFTPSLNTPSVLEIVAQPFAVSAPAFPDITLLLIIAWGLGFVTVVAFWLSRWLKLRLILRDAINLALAAPMPVKSTIALLEPGLVGIWRPVLLLPEGIAERLSAGEMQAILAHELCHLRRRDNLTAAFHMLVEALFWFYPLVWWLGARLIAERERSCDEAVLEAGNEPKTYVEGVLKVCKFYLHSPLDCAAGVSGADLNERMEKIMENRHTIRLNKMKKAILSAGAGLAIVLPLAAGFLTSPLSLGNTTAQAATNTNGLEG